MAVFSKVSFTNSFPRQISWTLWNYPQVNATEPHRWEVNIGLGIYSQSTEDYDHCAHLTLCWHHQARISAENFATFSKHRFYIEYHIHIWQVSIFKCFKGSNLHFHKSMLHPAKNLASWALVTLGPHMIRMWIIESGFWGHFYNR